MAQDAARKWAAFCDACLNSGFSCPNPSPLIETLKAVFSLSDFVARSAVRYPRVLLDLMESGDLEKKYGASEYGTKIQKQVFAPRPPEDEAQLCLRLRRFRLREFLRIAVRDLAGWAHLEETMFGLSRFADVCLERTLEVLYKWHCTRFGVPFGVSGDQQHLVVLAMGKLGGEELNFSSDIDLVFSYPEPGETKNGPARISNESFFTRLCQDLIRVIGAKTSDGFVFRVDTRLRPFGESGPLVMGFDAMETYYQYQGRDWERYSWIKARVAAGDRSTGQILLKRLRPFVYRKYLDYGVFESLRDMKQKIVAELTHRGMQENIKLGPGGIREIEFFGQIFQLIRGGVLPSLQEQGLLKVLNLLAQEGIIPQDVSKELTEAYCFLRHTEHRLQEFSDQQIHTLPEDPLQKLKLAVSMGFHSWPAFENRLKYHMEKVHYQFNMLLGMNEKDSEEAPDQKILKDLSDVWQTLLAHEKGEIILSEAGFKDPAKILAILGGLQNDPATHELSNAGMKRLNRLVPLMLKHAAASEEPDIVLNRIVELIKTIERRTTYLSLLLENPAVLAHLIELADAGAWIISYLGRHPVLLDELLYPRTLHAPAERAALERGIQEKLQQIPPNDLEAQIIALSISRQVNTLRVAVADVTGALPLMRISDYLTEIAEIILTHVLQLSWRHLAEKHGSPICLLHGETCPMGFCIIAYGKLGGMELGYGSDLDLVFLHAGTNDPTRGLSPIDNPQFFTRLGQRIIHILTASTPTGVLYDCDMRLRPDGGSGILVVHIEAFKEYQQNKAWAWEHQALIKARAVCGDPKLKAYFETIRQNTLALPRKTEKLQESVSTMRNRMRKELLEPAADNFDLKQGLGGLVDIEFLVQYLVLLHAHQYGRLTRWTDVVRILQTLAETGILSRSHANFLKETYLTYRSAIHRLSLQEKPAKVSANQFSELRKRVLEMWEEWINTEPGSG